jgi:solute carrier family 25 protein 33/36
MATAIATAPLDVLRTRLQSDIYSVASQSHDATSGRRKQYPLRNWIQRASATTHIITSSQKAQGWRGLYSGLGPSIVGLVPATAIKFYTYGNCKRIYAALFGQRVDSPWVHMAAAATAGIATGTATNPIWVVKTRVQLDLSVPTTTTTAAASGPRRQYKNSLDCAAQILQKEGIKGFYRGLSASYLGVVESTLHLVLYERMKSKVDMAEDDGLARKSTWGKSLSWIGVGSSAGLSKLVAGLLAYPHEVSYATNSYETNLNLGLQGHTDEVTTSPIGQWSAQIPWSFGLLLHDMERRRSPCPVWWIDAAHAACSPFCCYYPGRVRICSGASKSVRRG